LGPAEQQQLADTLGVLCGKLVEASGNAAADGSVRAVDEFSRLASGLDGVSAKLRLPNGLEPTHFQTSISGHVAAAHLKAAEGVLESDDPLDCRMLCRELTAIESLYHKDSDSGSAAIAVKVPQDVSDRILAFLDALELSLLKGACKLKSEDPGTSLVEAATAADKARAAAKRVEPSGDCSSKVSAVIAVNTNLGKAKVELQLPSGMDPRKVIKAITDIQQLWEPVKDVQPCHESLAEVSVLFNSKLAEACKKALAENADVREKKLQGVQSLAQETDKLMTAIIALSPGFLAEKAQEIVARVAADYILTVLDVELRKTSGRDPAVILKESAELSKVWCNLGGENAMDAAFDEVVSLKARWKETHSKVKDRMREAMDDALSSKQEAKKQNLLKFAEQFDSMCNQLAGDHGSLKEELLAKADQEDRAGTSNALVLSSSV